MSSDIDGNTNTPINEYEWTYIIMFQTNKYIKHNKKRQPGMAKAKKNDQFGIMLSNKYILFDTFGTKNPKNVPKQEKPLLCFSSPQNLSYSLLQLKKKFPADKK